jgi:hypothetical protein
MLAKRCQSSQIGINAVLKIVFLLRPVSLQSQLCPRYFLKGLLVRPAQSIGDLGKRVGWVSQCPTDRKQLLNHTYKIFTSFPSQFTRQPFNTAQICKICSFQGSESHNLLLRLLRKSLSRDSPNRIGQLLGIDCRESF